MRQFSEEMERLPSIFMVFLLKCFLSVQKIISQWQVVFKSISRGLKIKTDHVKLVLLVITDLVQSLHEIECIFSTHSIEMIS